MAEFPPNLDDGELWLPSVIFPDVGVCRRRHHRQAPSAGFSYVDDLAEKLAAFSLLDRSHLLRPKPHLSDRVRLGNGSFSRFGPVVARETGAGMLYDGFFEPAPVSWAMGAAAGGSRSVLPFSPAKPVQVEAFGQERSRVTSRQQPGPVQGGRFVPVRTGGSGREYGGTGVFLPRVNKIEAAAPTKKKASIKGGGEQQKQPARNAAIGKQRMPFHQAASEMGLPQDWTY